MASRMESHAIAATIQVGETTYQLSKDKYLLEKRGLIKVKGKGEMMTYILKEINLKV
ncbi:MAG: adenylate/guanylate cyclase domain-containing protein [Nostoc sp.]